MSPAEINSMINRTPLDLSARAGKHPAATFLERTQHYSVPYDHGYHREYSNGGGHGSYKKKKSQSVALTTLTLLAFMFFLHILQQCLQDHMDQMNPQVIIMQARQQMREAEAKKRVGASAGTIYINSSNVEKEPQFKVGKTTQTPEKDEYLYEYSQIPVKLKNRSP